MLKTRVANGGTTEKNKGFGCVSTGVSNATHCFLVSILKGFVLDTVVPSTVGGIAKDCVPVHGAKRPSCQRERATEKSAALSGVLTIWATPNEDEREPKMETGREAKGHTVGGMF